MDRVDPPGRHSISRDWLAITAALHSSHSPHRHASSGTTWRVWQRFCTATNVHSDLADVPGDPIPILLLFAHRYRTGTIAPGDRPVRSRTVEDAVRHVAQAFTRVGASDPRLNAFGALDFRLQALFRSWKKTDPPPTQVKPLPLLVLRSTSQGPPGSPCCRPQSPLAARRRLLAVRIFFPTSPR